MANFITIFRIFLVFISIILMFNNNTIAYITAVILTICAFALDGLDGYIARKFNETSKLGAMLDIMSDRIAENSYWVALAYFGLLPVVFPLISLTRGFVVDGVRSVAMSQGYTAFGETSMQTDKINYFICSSKFMRILYATVKVLAIILLILSATPGLDSLLALYIYIFGYICAMLAIMLCVLRGLPVLFESDKLFSDEKK